MKALFLSLIILSLTACATYRKGGDVRRSAMKLKNQAAQAKAKVDKDYEERRWIYKELRKAGYRTSDEPRRSMKRDLVKMKRIRRQLNEQLKGVDKDADALNQFAYGKKKIVSNTPDGEKLAAMVDLLKRKVKGLQDNAQIYMNAAKEYNDRLKEYKIYLLDTSNIQKQAQKVQGQIQSQVNKARSDIEKAAKRTVSSSKKDLLRKMRRVLKQVEAKGGKVKAELLKFKKKMGDKGKSLVTPKNDPQKFIGKIEAIAEEVQEDVSYYKELVKKYND